MNRMINLLQQDFKLLLRNAIFWVISASLILIIVAVNFAIPKEDSLNEISLADYNYPIEASKHMSSPEEVEAYVKDTGGVGLISDDNKLTIVHDGLSQKEITALASFLVPPGKPLPDIGSEVIRTESRTVPQNLRLTPIFICFEAIVLGFLMAAILLFGEKQDMVLKAYKISPGGVWAYITSKTLLFTVIGSLYAFLMALLTVGVHFDIIQFFIITALGCMLYTLLGLSLAVFFKDISGWFFIAVLVLGLNMLPMISYSIPTFSPGWISFIPSYSSLFAYEEVLFFHGKSLLGTYGLLLAEITGAWVLCYYAVKKKLLAAD